MTIKVYLREDYDPLGGGARLTEKIKYNVISCEINQVYGDSSYSKNEGKNEVVPFDLNECSISLGPKVLPKLIEILTEVDKIKNQVKKCAVERSKESLNHLILIAPALDAEIFQPSAEQVKNGEHLLCAGYALSRLWSRITVLYCSGRPVFLDNDKSNNENSGNNNSCRDLTHSSEAFQKLGSAGPSAWLNKDEHQVLENVYAYDVAPLVDVYSDCLHAMLCSPEFLGALGSLIRTGRFPVEMVERREAVAAKPKVQGW